MASVGDLLKSASRLVSGTFGEHLKNLNKNTEIGGAGDNVDWASIEEAEQLTAENIRLKQEVIAQSNEVKRLDLISKKLAKEAELSKKTTLSLKDASLRRDIESITKELEILALEKHLEKNLEKNLDDEELDIVFSMMLIAA